MYIYIYTYTYNLCIYIYMQRQMSNPKILVRPIAGVAVNHSRRPFGACFFRAPRWRSFVVSVSRAGARQHPLVAPPCRRARLCDSFWVSRWSTTAPPCRVVAAQVCRGFRAATAGSRTKRNGGAAGSRATITSPTSAGAASQAS